VPVNEGSTWTTDTARWYRSAGIGDCITYEGFSSGTKRPDRGHRNAGGGALQGTTGAER
jgi:hypothetical protein